MTTYLTPKRLTPMPHAPLSKVPRWDVLAPFDPCASSALLCQITSSLSPREALFAPENEGAGAGGAPGAGASDKTFTQADVDRIVQERVGKLNEKIKTLEAQSTRLVEIEAKLLESDQREAKAREEAELKGKTETEKLQHQIQKSTEAAKKAEAEWQKKLADIESQKTQAEQRFLDHVKRSAVTDALTSAGALKGAGRDATLSFLSEAQIELGEDHQIKTITVGGKSFDKPGEAAKHFLTEKPWYAEPPQGGSGGPRTGNGGAGGNNVYSGTVSGLLSQGLAEMNKR